MEIDRNLQQQAEQAAATITDAEQPRAPVDIYLLDVDAEQLLAVYGALRVYLRTLAAQETEDLEMLARVTALLSTIRPRAIEASRSLALKSVSP